MEGEEGHPLNARGPVARGAACPGTMLAAQRTSTVAVPRLLRASRRPLAVSASSHSPAKMEKARIPRSALLRIRAA